MAIKLDDFLSKKKEPAQVLDLSKIRLTSKEEFKKYFDKIPEYKIKPEKVLPESIKIREKDFSFTPGRREEKHSTEWSYPDPVPPDMKTVRLEDLCPVNIDWKMLTTLRPKTKVEEDLFSRLVQLGKLNIKHEQSLNRERDTDWVRKTKNPRSSIVETKVVSCKECGEDFCDGSLCVKLMYENFFRIQQSSSTGVVKEDGAVESGEEGKIKKKPTKKKVKRRSRSKVRRRKPRKNSIFNRAGSQSCNKDHSRRGSHGNIQAKIRAHSAARAASLSRSRSRDRTNESKIFGVRAKSAPRIQFHPAAGGTQPQDPNAPNKKDLYVTSGPSQTDYSSQSDSEGLQARKTKTKFNKRRKRPQVGFVDGYQSDTGDYHPRTRITRECMLQKAYYSEASEVGSQESDDSGSEKESPTRGRRRRRTKSPPKPQMKPPTTIQLEFDDLAPSSSYMPGRSYVPTKLTSGKRLEVQLHELRHHDITKVTDGFSKIDLAFREIQVQEQSAVKKSTRGVKSAGKGARPKPNVPELEENTFIVGKSIQPKPRMEFQYEK